MKFVKEPSYTNDRNALLKLRLSLAVTVILGSCGCGAGRNELTLMKGQDQATFIY